MATRPHARRGAGREDRDEPDGSRGLLTALAGEARRLLVEPVERLAEAAREESERVAHASRAEARYLAASARRAATFAAAGLVAAILVVIGISGALGELLGRPWAGQLAAGGLVIAAVVVWGLLSRRRARHAREKDADATHVGKEAGSGGLSLASLLLVGAAGWLAAHFLSGRDEQD